MTNPLGPTPSAGPARSVSVPVDDGALHVGVWGDPETADHVVLAVHGITANHTSMAGLAAALGDDAAVVAPDLRGRGASRSVGTTSSMAHHARDLVAVLDTLVPAGRTVTVVGHSMGGFVAIALAHLAPSRLHHVVLLDGGPQLPLPEGLDVDQVLAAVLGPSIARLSMTFESEDAYVDWWRPHVALAQCWGPVVEDHCRYDCVPDGAGAFRSGVSLDHVRGDATSQLLEPAPPLRLPVPTTFVRAERGLQDEEGGLYPLAVFGPMLADAGIEVTELPGSNHYSVAWAAGPTAALADHVRSVW